MSFKDPLSSILGRTADGRKGPWLGAVLVFAFTFAAFLPSLGNGFVDMDDNLFITGNPRVQGGLTWDNLRWAFTFGGTQQWHPIVWLSHMLDCELYGLAARGHHLTSLLFHSANAALLFGALASATGAAGPSLAAAALWAVHPMRVESVAWAAERRDVLCGFFVLLALIAHGRWTRAPAFGRYAAVLAASAAALASKPTAVVLPLLLWISDVWPFGRAGDAKAFARAGLEKLPVAALAGGVAALTLAGHGPSTVALAEVSIDGRLAHAVSTLGSYLQRTAVPWPLGHVQAAPHLLPPPPVAAVLVWALVLLATTFGAWRARRGSPHLLAGWSWFVVALAPVSGIVIWGYSAGGDRYAYLPHMGLAAAVAWLGARAAVRPGVAATAALVLAALTWNQTLTWKDTLSMWRQAARAHPSDPLVQSSLGVQLARAGETEEARRAFERAIELAPASPVPYGNLGRLLAETGRKEEARKLLEKALELRPGYEPAERSLQLLKGPASEKIGGQAGI